MGTEIMTKYLHISNESDVIHLEVIKCLGDVEVFEPILTFYKNTDYIYNTTGEKVLKDLARGIQLKTGLTLVEDHYEDTS